MKRFIFATLIFTVLVSGCSGRNRGDSIPIHPDTYSRSTSERLSAAAPKEENAVLKEIAILKKEIASLKKKKNAVLKEENTIPSHVEICSLPSGCKSDESGKCIGCIVKKRDIGTLEFKPTTSSLAGDYIMTTAIFDGGVIHRWTTPLKIEIRNINKNTYLMTVSGKGVLGEQSIDCSDPYVGIFAVDSDNVETSFKTVNGGSCPSIITSDHIVKWEYNEHGLKKSKSYSDGICHIGPCDWISTKINVFIYERI